MRFIADLHIHSKYSRATSKEMNLESLDRWAKIKGIKVMGTGDFTHPAWFKEIKEKLEPAESGLYKLKGSETGTRFLLTVEISSIYSQGGKTRRVHNLIFAPNIEVAEKIDAALDLRGNIKSDGRPILGLSSIELAELVFGISEEVVIIPAHAWTPWFSVFGSMSGFDTIEECFGEYADRIFAIETGLSSDPAMNWRLSKLDKISLISNSDAHSVEKIGREVNVFDTELSFGGIIDAIKNRDLKKFLYTIEFFPEEGKYHYDGHRSCGVVMTPEETKKNKKICPKCGKLMTVGVMYRVNELADRPNNFTTKSRVPFKKAVPLLEIIKEILGVASVTKKVKAEYERLIGVFGTELAILIDTPIKEIKKGGSERLADAIDKMRKGNINIQPGYDGEYGKVSIFGGEKMGNSQNNDLF